MSESRTSAQGSWRVTSALLTIQLIFGIHYPVSKLIVAELAPAAWACLRVASAFVVLLALALGARRRLPPLRSIVKLGILSIFGVILNQALFLEGIARTTAGHSALMNTQIPSFALLAAIALGQERLDRFKLGSFLLGLAGVLVLLELDRFRFDSRYLTGDLLTLCNAASFGLFLALSRRVMPREDPLVAVTLIFFFGSLGMLAFGGRALAAADLGALSTPVWVGMLFAVFFATVLTYFLNIWAVKRTHTSHVALYIFLQPLVAAFLGVIFLGERISARLLLALILVFAALYLRDLGVRRSASPRAT